MRNHYQCWEGSQVGRHLCQARPAPGTVCTCLANLSAFRPGPARWHTRQQALPAFSAHLSAWSRYCRRSGPMSMLSVSNTDRLQFG